MRKYFLLFLTTLFLCGLTSCTVDNDESKTEDYKAMLVNTRWKLSKIQNQNNAWVDPSEYTEFDIKDLRFGTGNYEMVTNNYYGNHADNTFHGTYSFGDGDLNFYSSYPGKFISLKISYLRNDEMDGLITLWGESEATYSPDGNQVIYKSNPKHYNIRLSKIK